MLVLTRRDGESLTVGEATLYFKFTSRGTLRVSIDAPRDVKIWRGELKPREAQATPDKARAGEQPVAHVRDAISAAEKAA